MRAGLTWRRGPRYIAGTLLTAFTPIRRFSLGGRLTGWPRLSGVAVVPSASFSTPKRHPREGPRANEVLGQGSRSRLDQGLVGHSGNVDPSGTNHAPRGQSVPNHSFVGRVVKILVK